MKAMILAAGLGTRLRPLTDSRPKALVEINGRTLLEITLARLRSFGFNEVIVNVHHLADMVVDYLKSHDNFGMRIEISREDDLLLDTGGGLKKAAWFFLAGSKQIVARKSSDVIPGEASNPGKTLAESTDDTLRTSAPSDESFLLHNVDVISTIDLPRMLQTHNERNALATLAVQSRESSRLLLFNDKNQLVGRAARGAVAWKNVISGSPTVVPSAARNPGKESPQGKNDQAVQASPHQNSALGTRHSPLPLAFSGIHIISPRLLSMLTEEGVFSIIDAYLRLAAHGEKILAFRADEYYWRDLGRPADLSQAALDLPKWKV